MGLKLVSVSIKVLLKVRVRYSIPTCMNLIYKNDTNIGLAFNSCKKNMLKSNRNIISSKNAIKNLRFK